MSSSFCIEGRLVILKQQHLAHTALALGQGPGLVKDDDVGLVGQLKGRSTWREGVDVGGQRDGGTK